MRRTWHLWHRSPASASSSPAPPAWSADRSPRRSPPTTPCTAARGSATRKAREPHEASGATTVRVDLGDGRLRRTCPDDRLDYVLNFAVARSNDWEADFAANVEGVALAHGALRQGSTRSSSAPPRACTSRRGTRRSPRARRSATATAPPGTRRTRSARSRPSRSCSTPRRGLEHADGDRAPQRPVRRHVRMADVPADDGRARHADRRAPRRTVPTYSPLHLVDIVGSLPYLLAAASVPATS